MLSLFLLASLSATEKPSPVFKDIALGLGHACALRSSGEIICWGSSNAYRYPPPLGDRFESLVCDGDKSFCALSRGEVICWGHPQAGLGRTAKHFVAVDVGAGDDVCGITEDGELHCQGDAWGRGAERLPGKVAEISMGFDVCVRFENGRVRCNWNHEQPKRYQPHPRLRFRHIAAGGGLMCGILRNHKIHCWADKEDTDYQSHPILTPPKGRFKVISASSSTDVMCGITSEGGIKCWGDFSERFGAGLATPPAGRFVALDVGAFSACGLLDSGKTIECFGPSYVKKQNPPSGLVFSSLVGVSSYAGCGLDRNQRVHCWGNPPLEGKPPDGGPYVALATSAKLVCALDAERRLFCWGKTEYETEAGPTGEVFDAITSDRGTICGVRARDKAILCWGENASVVHP